MNIILRCFAATCLLLFSVSALGDDHRRSKNFVMFNAGTLIVGIEQTLFLPPLAPDLPPPPPVPDIPISIIEEKSRGTLGRADLKTFAVVDLTAESFDCDEGFFDLATTIDTIVLTFHDLSQLVGKGKAYVCVNEVNGTQEVRGEGHWVSGSRRFAYVMGGTYYLNSTATPQSANGQYYSTVGRITGRIKRQ